MLDLPAAPIAKHPFVLRLEIAVQNPDAMPQYLVFVASERGIVIVGRGKAVDLIFEDAGNPMPILKDQVAASFALWKAVIIVGGRKRRD